MGNTASTTSIPSPKRVAFDEKDDFLDLAESMTALQASATAKPLSRTGALTLGHVATWEASASSNSKVQLARTILSQSDLRSVLTSRTARIADQHIFNNTLDFKTGPVTNQKSSGRCWLFATTNVIRYNVMKRLKLKDFQLSQVRLSSPRVSGPRRSFFGAS